jgi:hypothetical protein
MEERGAHRDLAKLDVGCEFVGIQIPLTADLKHLRRAAFCCPTAWPRCWRAKRTTGYFGVQLQPQRSDDLEDGVEIGASLSGECLV